MSKAEKDDIIMFGADKIMKAGCTVTDEDIDKILKRG